MLTFVAALGFVLESIPKSVLAGLLVYTGVRLVNVKHIRELLEHRELGVYLVTVGGVVFIDLLKGVAIGFSVALLALVWRMARVSITTAQSGDAWRVVVRGALTFLAVPKAAEALAKVPAGARVSVDLGVGMLDHAGWEAIHSWKATHEKTGGVVTMEQLPDVMSAPVAGLAAVQRSGT